MAATGKREQLIEQRKAAGFTQESLAEALGVERTTVGRWEAGRGDPQPWKRAKLAAALRISPDALSALLTPAEVASAEPVADQHPNEALALSEPGLPLLSAPTELTPDAAPAVGSSMALMNGQVRIGCRTSDGRIIFVTMPRRALLQTVTAATGASVLSGFTAPLPAGAAQPVLSPEVHPVQNLRQLRRSLVECDNMLGPRHVVATAQEHISLIQRLRRESTGSDRNELMRVQAEYAEFVSWLYQDSGDHTAAQYWADRATDWSNACGDRDLAVYVTARKAQLAGDMKDPEEAVDLADYAQRLAPAGSRLSAMGAVYGAHGLALMGDGLAAQRAYEQALELVNDPKNETGIRRGHWLDEAYVEAQRARSLSVLGQHHAAVAGFDRAVRALPASYRRDRGVYLARSALAHLHATGPEQAATVGREALAVAAATGSARIFSELATLDAQLQRWPTVAEVIGFRVALDSILLHEA